MKDIHRLTPEEALARLGSTASGLTAAKAAARLAQVTSGRLGHHAAIAVARKAGNGWIVPLLMPVVLVLMDAVYKRVGARR
ncbi:MAG: hypothetical protein K6U74_09305 [Firmicutes bacterium]|nr:hypothetical protein [Bacillota bacterium]